MSLFRFRLEAVRKIREAHEKERAGDLAEAITEVGAADGDQQRLAALEQAGRSEIVRLEGDVGRQRSVTVMLEHLTEHKKAAEHRVREAAARVKERHAAFLEAVTKRKAIDRLKERRFREWDADSRRREQKRTDEVNSNRYGSKGDGAGRTRQQASEGGDE